MADDKGELIGTLMEMLGDNPEQKIMSALSSLGIGNENAEKEPVSETKEEKGTEWESLLQIGNLLSEVSGEDERACLLNALKPFLSEDKRPKIDRAVKLLKLAKVAEAAGKTDLLNNFKL